MSGELHRSSIFLVLEPSDYIACIEYYNPKGPKGGYNLILGTILSPN